MTEFDIKAGLLVSVALVAAVFIVHNVGSVLVIANSAMLLKYKFKN